MQIIKGVDEAALDKLAIGNTALRDRNKSSKREVLDSSRAAWLDDTRNSLGILRLIVEYKAAGFALWPCIYVYHWLFGYADQQFSKRAGYSGRSSVALNCLILDWLKKMYYRLAKKSRKYGVQFLIDSLHEDKRRRI